MLDTFDCGHVVLSCGPATVDPGPDCAVISLHEIDEAAPGWIRGRTVLRVHFSEVTRRWPGRPDHRPVTPAQLQAIITWAGALPRGTRLHVHCAAGVCRSSAVTLALLGTFMTGAGDDDVIAALRHLNPHAWPNAHLRRVAARVSGRRTDAAVYWAPRPCTLDTLC